MEKHSISFLKICIFHFSMRFHFNQPQIKYKINDFGFFCYYNYLKTE
jgi:hypothetical protein